jgi:hypothetical protein
MTLHLLKVHLQTFLSIPVNQICQILCCDLLSQMDDLSKACTGFKSSDTGIKVSSPTRGIDILSLLLFCVFFCDGTVLATSRYPAKGSYHIIYKWAFKMQRGVNLDFKEKWDTCSYFITTLIN